MTKIVFTGYGVIASKTQNINAFLNNLQNGVCCLDSVEGYGPGNQLVIAGLIDSRLEEFESNKQLKRLPRVTKTTYQKVNDVVITNHGYGGNNACAYIRRY